MDTLDVAALTVGGTSRCSAPMSAASSSSSNDAAVVDAAAGATSDPSRNFSKHCAGDRCDAAPVALLSSSAAYRVGPSRRNASLPDQCHSARTAWGTPVGDASASPVATASGGAPKSRRPRGKDRRCSLSTSYSAPNARGTVLPAPAAGVRSGVAPSVRGGTGDAAGVLPGVRWRRHNG